MWPYPWTHVRTPSHLGHMDRVAATMPSQAHAGAAQEAPDIGQWEGQDVPLVRPSSCNVKGGIPSSRRYLPTYLPQTDGRSVRISRRTLGFHGIGVVHAQGSLEVALPPTSSKEFCRHKGHQGGVTACGRRRRPDCRRIVDDVDICRS